jgi:DNA (cytosine-5)-methyltransferase 1
MNGIDLPKNTGTCFAALGNAVNADIVRLIAEKLILKSDMGNINNSLSAKNVINYEQ